VRENVKVESSNRELHEAMALASYRGVPTGLERSVLWGAIVFSFLFWGMVYHMIFG
jgi:hypothetical protein